MIFLRVTHLCQHPVVPSSERIPHRRRVGGARLSCHDNFSKYLDRPIMRTCGHLSRLVLVTVECPQVQHDRTSVRRSSVGCL